MAHIVGVDVGGTFTDVYVFDSDGETQTAKAPTTPDAIGGVLDALRQVVDPSEVGAMSLGSTIATNALVQRKLARVGLLTTRGFRDALDLRRLWRPHLFGHTWNRPAAVVSRPLRFEATGRIDWRGEEILPLQEADVRQAAARMVEAEVEAVAVSFLFSYLNPTHEERAREILADEMGDIPVLISSGINPERNEYERTSTTAIGAGLAPIVDRALGDVDAALKEAGMSRPPRIMKSNGGVMSLRAARERPVELIKSGPAGGAAAGAYLAERLSEDNLILLDIGGTTADASLIIDKSPVYANQDAVEWDITIRVPVVDIKSVGAGGGSIARLDDAGALRVGPQSAGAVPGPVAYRRGGTEPTVTDAAIVAGLIDPSRFLGGAMEIDEEAAGDSLGPIADGLGYSREESAAAIMHVACVEMATLVRKITVDRGLDPRDFTLVAFGGAGPLFVGPLMEELGLRRALVPANASTLSAMGGAYADVIFQYRRSEVATLTKVTSEQLARGFGDLAERARADIAMEGLQDVELRTSVDLRYAGQWREIEIATDPNEDIQQAVARFEEEHQRLWGHRRVDDEIELTGVRLRAVSKVDKPAFDKLSTSGAPIPDSVRDVTHYSSGTSKTTIHARESLEPGVPVRGPAIVEEAQTTTVILPDQQLVLAEEGYLEVTQA